MAHHCDTASIQAADWQAVEGGGHKATPSSDEERVHCNVGIVGCISKYQMSDAAQNKAPIEKASWHWQQAILQSSKGL